MLPAWGKGQASELRLAVLGESLSNVALGLLPHHYQSVAASDSVRRAREA